MVGLFQPGNIGAVGNDGVEQGCLPAAVAFVGGANLAFQAAKTPAIDQKMMKAGYQIGVVVGDPDQRQSDERGALQLEASGLILGQQSLDRKSTRLNSSH